MLELTTEIIKVTGLWQAMLAAVPLDIGTIDAITPVKIPFTDTVTLDKGSGAEINVITHRINILTDGVYKVAAQGTFEFQLSGELLLSFYKNGVAYGAPVPIQGRGAGKSVMAMNSGVMNLVAGDYIEGFAVAETGSFNLIMTSGMAEVERTIFT